MCAELAPEIKVVVLANVWKLALDPADVYVIVFKSCSTGSNKKKSVLSVLALVILVWIFKNFEKNVFFLLSIVFLLAALLAFYHFGIEQGFIEESAVCNIEQNSNDLTKEDLLKELNSTRISCKDVDFKIFGFSLATINAFISLIFSIIAFRIFINYEKKW